MNNYTPHQASEIAEVASSTLRKYVAQFRIFFSPGSQTLRGRRFLEQDILVIRKIKEGFANGLSIGAIERSLQMNNEGIAYPVPDVESAPFILTTEDELPEFPPVIAASGALERLENHQQTQDEKIATIEVELKQMRAALHRAKEDQERLLRRVEELERAPLWDRLRGTPKRSGK